MEIKNLICITCPVGCRLEIEMEDENNIRSISGNKCPKGPIYAREEITNPLRIVTTTVELIGGDEPRLSVKTQREIPKGKIFASIKALKGVKVQAPVRVGDIVLKNVAGTDVDIVATTNSELCQTTSLFAQPCIDLYQNNR